VAPVALPNRPGGQGPAHVGDPAPLTLPYEPAPQGPLQDGVDSRAAAPYVPGGHRLHIPAPPTLYVFGPQATALSFQEPAGHAKPGAHGPAQLDCTAPVTLPYRPTSHGPLQAGVVKLADAPYVPTGQFTHTAAPLTEYCPTPHATAVPFVDPGGQAYPALHAAVQFAAVAPADEPKRPPAHGPLQALEFRPAPAP
jgi:hypothetical protein